MQAPSHGLNAGELVELGARCDKLRWMLGNKAKTKTTRRGTA